MTTPSPLDLDDQRKERMVQVITEQLSVRDILAMLRKLAKGIKRLRRKNTALDDTRESLLTLVERYKDLTCYENKSEETRIKDLFHTFLLNEIFPVVWRRVSRSPIAQSLFDYTVEWYKEQFRPYDPDGLLTSDQAQVATNIVDKVLIPGVVEATIQSILTDAGKGPEPTPPPPETLTPPLEEIVTPIQIPTPATEPEPEPEREPERERGRQDNALQHPILPFPPPYEECIGRVASEEIEILAASEQPLFQEVVLDADVRPVLNALFCRLLNNVASPGSRLNIERILALLKSDENSGLVDAVNRLVDSELLTSSESTVLLRPDIQQQYATSFLRFISRCMVRAIFLVPDQYMGLTRVARGLALTVADSKLRQALATLETEGEIPVNLKQLLESYIENLTWCANYQQSRVLKGFLYLSGQKVVQGRQCPPNATESLKTAMQHLHVVNSMLARKQVQNHRMLVEQVMHQYQMRLVEYFR